MSEATLDDRVVLVTGAARRIGAAIVTRLHENGARVAIHCRHSIDDAEALADRLNDERPESTVVLTADLGNVESCASLVSATVDWGGRLDGLVNNASSFYPTPVGSVTEEQWEDLFSSNLKGPFFLAQAAMGPLRTARGSIVNLVDIHSQRPLRNHPVYGSAKAGLAMLTRALAKDLAPQIRVNGVSPGAILWPEDGMDEDAQRAILDQIPLAKTGSPEDIAGCVLYLMRDADYVTGQVIAVDGGRSTGW